MLLPLSRSCGSWITPFAASALKFVNFCYVAEIATIDSFRGMKTLMSGFCFSRPFVSQAVTCWRNALPFRRGAYWPEQINFHVYSVRCKAFEKTAVVLRLLDRKTKLFYLISQIFHKKKLPKKFSLDALMLYGGKRWFVDSWMFKAY